MAKTSRILGCLFPYRGIDIKQVSLRPTQAVRGEKYSCIDDNYAKEEYFALTFDGGEDGEECIMLKEEMLKELRDKIDAALGNIGKKLHAPNELAEKINEYLANDALCRDCKFRATMECPSCWDDKITQSPLERKMRNALREAGINFEQQYALNRQGERVYGSLLTNELGPYYTCPDFYVYRKESVNGIKKELKLCIYTDGDTYHNTNERIRKDKEQDRLLQGSGYKSFRYTTDDVNNNLYTKIIPELKSIIEDITKW